jgi:putative flippase GtrA
MAKLNKTTLTLLGRFAIVGGFSTGMFMLAQYVFLGVLHVSVLVGTTLSFGVSLATSYFGHHAITFRRTGAHLHYGPRFIVVTVVMLVISNFIAYGMVTVVGVNYLWGSLIIALIYPVGSFVLQSLWVFADRPGSGEWLRRAQ